MTSPSGFRNEFSRRYANGAILFVAMIFLIIITIMALTASGTSLMQEKMVSGLRNAQLASNGAESALRDGESKLWNAALNGGGDLSLCGTQGLLGCYSFTPPPQINSVVQNFRTSSTLPWSTLSTYPGVQTYSTTTMTNLPSAIPGGAPATLSQNPVYIIEDLGPDLPPGAGSLPQVGIGGASNTNGITMHIYRITARSVGGNGTSTMRVVESTFASKSN